MDNRVTNFFATSPSRKFELLLVLLWIVFQIFFFFHFGIVTDLEATKYITEAKYFLATGHYTSSQFIFYSTQIFLIAFCLKTGLGYLTVVLIQIFFNGLSLFCFYKLLVFLTKRTWLPLAATAFFLLQFYYHLYNVYLFTESLFFSFSVIYAWYLFTVTKLNFKSIIIITGFLVLLYFTRPTSIFFIPSTLLFIVIKFFPARAFRIILFLSAIGLAALYFLLNYSLGIGGEFDFLLPYLDERVICGVPTISTPHDLIVPGKKNSIEGLWYIITHYHQLFFKLGIKRLAAFFGMVRSHYSFVHNLFIAGYFYFMYLVALLGIGKVFKHYKPHFWFVLSQVGFTAITVTLSCDEWHNRFMFAVFPFILIIAVLSAHFLFPVKDKNVQQQAT